MQLTFTDITINDESPEQVPADSTVTENLRVNYTEEANGYLYVTDHADGAVILIHNVGSGTLPIYGYQNGDPQSVTTLAAGKFALLTYSAPMERWVIVSKTA